MKQSASKLILAIDGGGTKTDLVLANDQGRILAKVKTGQGNIHNDSPASITREFSRGIQQLYRKAKIARTRKLSALAVGLAGIDSTADAEVAKRIIVRACKGILPPASKQAIVNDTIIGYWSGTDAKTGMCLIGGTGSNCYGRTASGKEAWAGGLGHILADEGGGYYQGMRALQAAAKSYDGRGPKTMLEKMIVKHYGVSSIRDLMRIVYQPAYGKTQIGELGYLVEEAAIKGDKVALQIANDSADELARLAVTVGKKLKFEQIAFDFVLIGGVIQKDPVVQRRFKRQVKKQFPNVRFIIPEQKPVMGAVRLALSLLKARA